MLPKLFPTGLLTIFLVIVINQVTLGQNQCFKYDADQARKDIASGIPRLLRAGGIAPFIVVFQDSLVEKRFGIKYEDLGDTWLDSDSC